MKPTKFTTPYSINLNTAEFKEAIDIILEKHPDITEIIETGTFNGMGSTKVFANTKKDVFTIECNINNYNQAVSNLREYDNVCVFHGLSMDRHELIKKLMLEDFKSDVQMDSKYPKPFYMREICQSVVQDDLLYLLCANERRQLIFLDSAGGVGFIEFCYLITFSKLYLEKKILVLDDCNHVKHKRSVEMLYKMGYIVNISLDNRFAWCDLSTSGSMPMDEAESRAKAWMEIK